MIKKEAEIFGLLFLGDGAIISWCPLLNILTSEKTYQLIIIYINNNIHHYHKRLGACLFPNGVVNIESRMNCCALFTCLNSSTASSDFMPVISGSCFSGWSCWAKNLYPTFISRLVTPGSNSKTHSESVSWLSMLFA